MLECGRVAPLQSLAYSFVNTVSAFRQFARSQHVGKVVSRMPSTGATAAVEEDTSLMRWVISGGLGSLGILTADWLVGHGQSYLMLLSRMGR
jgi:hypothetical protein